jgi:hypothetical protein
LLAGYVYEVYAKNIASATTMLTPRYFYIRQPRSRQTLARLAGFPAIKTLEDYDFATGAPRQRLQELAGMAFYSAKRT